MHKRYLGNDSKAATDVVRSLYDTSSLSVVGDGQENLVIIVDESLIVRFPRSEEVWLRGVTERRVLQRLGSLPLPVPKLMEISDDPAYIIVSYLHGHQILSEELRSLPAPTLERVGETIAAFAFELHRNLSLKEFRPLIRPPFWSYDDYLKRVLFDKTNENPRIDALAKEYYHKWSQRKIRGKEVVVHDDLHLGNLLFDDSSELSGVLDFGAVCIGTAEQELRQTYRLGDAGFEAAASTYERLSGEPFDRALAKLWTITQELATYCRDDSKAVHARAAENLRFWFPYLRL